MAERKLTRYPFPKELANTKTDFGDDVLDKHGDIWFLVNLQKGICRFNIHTQQFEQFRLGKDIYHKRLETDSLIFLQTFSNSRNFAIDIYSKKMVLKGDINFPLHFEKDFAVIDIHVDYLNRVWMTTMSKGLILYDPQQKKIFRFSHDNSKQKSLTINYTRSLFEDNQHNLWIGTDGGGVCRLDLKRPKFNLFPLNEGDYPFLKDYFIKSFYEDGKGHLWFGTLYNGICRMNLQTGELDTIGHTSSKPGSFSTNLTGAFLEDSKGRLWAGSSMNVGIYDTLKRDFIPVETDNRFQRFSFNIFIYHLTELSDGTMMASTSQGLMHIVQEGKRWKGVYPSQAFTHLNIITFLQETSPGELWYTSPINGLYHVQYKKGVCTFVEKLFPNTDLRSIHVDEEDPAVIWIASGIGLIRLNTVTKEHFIYGSPQGMHNSYVYGILEDAQHNLWMSTNGGISLFNKHTKQFTNYTGKDGLQSDEFNTGAFHKGKSGTFYFGGIRGFNWFKPFEQTANNISPKAAITQLWVNDEPVKNDSLYFYERSIRLPYFKNDIQFELAALDFSRPEANKLEYQLEGWENKPLFTYGKQVRYSNLPPGKYRFVYRISNAYANWSEPATIHITITPPFWQTWWFYTIVAISVVGATIFITGKIARRKLNQKIAELERQRVLDKERQRISREMHDDIGAGLTQIILMSESAKNKATASNRKELLDISDTSRQLVGNISEIIWSLNPENKTLEQLFAYMREHIGKQLEYAGIGYHIDLPDDANNTLLSNEQLRNILLVAKETVNNAIRHSRANNIMIKAICRPGSLQFEVKDDGLGFDPQKNHPGNGLRNIRQRTDEIGGEMNIESGNGGKGSRFIYIFPVNTT